MNKLEQYIKHVKQTAALVGVGLTIASCGPETKPIQPTLTPTNTTGVTETLQPQTSPTSTLAPTETGASVTPEFTKTPEEIAKEFEALLWQTGVGSPTVIYAQPIVKDAAGDWQIDTTKPEEELRFSGVRFRVANVTAVPQEDGSTEYQGYISGYTGDHRIYRVPLALLNNSGDWIFKAQPIERFQGEESDVVALYDYNVGEDNFYLNKAWNVLQSARLMTISMMDEPITARGGEFSLLRRLDAKHNFFDTDLYRLGHALLVNDLVPAGGACGGAAPMARMFYQAELLGYGHISEKTPHVESIYLDFPYGGPEDGIDATVFYREKYPLDLKFINDSDEDLYIITRVSLFPYPEGLPDGGRELGWWPNTWSPSPVKLMLSYELTTTPPTTEDLQAIEDQMEWLDWYIKSRPMGQTRSPSENGSQEGEPYYTLAEVEKSYTLVNGGRIEDIVVDPKIKSIIETLPINIHGDITDLLIRAIPADNAPGQSEPTVRIFYSGEYRPHWSLDLVANSGLPMVPGFEHEYLDVQAIASLQSLYNDALVSGIPFFTGHGFRDDEVQRQLDLTNPGAAAGIGNSEHVSGLSIDIYANQQGTTAPGSKFRQLANAYGWVNSNYAETDPAHYLCLNCIIPGATKALIEAGINPNSRYVVAQARLAYFQLLVAQAKSQ